MNECEIIEQSAVVPYLIDNGIKKIILITAQNLSRNWIVPKGHVEKNMTPQASAQKAQRWIKTCLATHTGSDWRTDLDRPDDAMRGLGSMEGNGAHIIADRMKGKGRSWSTLGALHMAKVKELVLNQEIRDWCWPATQSVSQPPAPPPPKSRKRRDTATWLWAKVPVLHGNHPQREWVR